MIPNPHPELHDRRFADKWTDLASERIGGTAVYATDDFFAEKENMLKAGRGVFIADKYTDRGKWMDGWESRRKRGPGYDYCIIKLGAPGVIRGVDIDTNHFLGNHPPYASVDACFEAGDLSEKENVWETILIKSPLERGSQNLYEIKSDKIYSHVRLNIFPDGGVARFRVYGDVSVTHERLMKQGKIDLISIGNGGQAIACSDMFFSDKSNLIMPGRGINMGDGWETKRRRGINWEAEALEERYAKSGHDWVILKSAFPGILSEVEIDTAHFKGNFPYSCRLEYGEAITGSGSDTKLVNPRELMPEMLLKADTISKFSISHTSSAQYYRFSIFPDGGVSRLRLYGKVV